MAESRQGLLQWVNDLLGLNIVKLEQLGTGAAYCQLMDAIYGGVPLHRIIFNPRTDFETLQNYKILQAAFVRNKISRSFDAVRLSKCRLQDNLELCQWMHKQWLERNPAEPYDGAARREAAVAAAAAVNGTAGVGSAPLPGSRSSSAARLRPASGMRSASGARPPSVMRDGAGASKVTAGAAGSFNRPPTTPHVNGAGSTSSTRRTTSGAMGVGGVRRLSQTPAAMARAGSAAQTGVAGSSGSSGDARKVAALEASNQELEQQLAEHEAALVVVTRERTLYYSKLLEIESLVQRQLDDTYKQKGPNAGMDSQDPVLALTRQMQEILYATAEGFETPFRPEDEPF